MFSLNLLLFLDARISSVLSTNSFDILDNW